MDHATDAFIEVTAKDLNEAFKVVADSVIDITLDAKTVEEKEYRRIIAEGKDLNYLLFSWIEELIFVLITDGFAIRRTELDIKKNENYKIIAMVFGEPLDFHKHNFKVEIKAPTFYEMRIKQDGGVLMRFLMDL